MATLLPALTPQSNQERNVYRVALIMLVTVAIGVAIGYVLLIQGGLLESALRDGIIALWTVYALICAVAFWLSRRGYPAISLRLILGGLLIIFPLMALRGAGAGLVQGMGVVLITLVILAQVKLLPREIAFWVTASLVAGLATLFLATFAPSTSETPPAFLNSFTPIILGIELLLLAFFAARQFNDYPIRTKLILAFVGVTLVSLVFVTIVTTQVIRQSLTNQVGEDLNILAQAKALQVSSLIEKQVDTLQTLALSQNIQQAAETANLSYGGDVTANRNQVTQKNVEWTAAKDSATMVQDLIHNKTTGDLLGFIKTFPVQQQVLVTDKYGGLIGATTRPDKFDNSGEPWWRAAFNGGKGGIYVGQPEFNSKDQVLGVPIALPVRAQQTGEVVGVLRSTFGIADLTQLLSAQAFGNTGNTEIFLPSGEILKASGDVMQAESDMAARWKAMPPGSAQEMDYGGAASLVTYAPIKPAGFAGADSAIGKLGWSLVVEQNAAEALAAVNTAGQAAVLAGLGALLLAGILGLTVAQRLSNPIRRLTNVTRRVAAGDMTATAAVESNDEIGALSSAFNTMTQQLQESMGSLQQANTRLAETNLTQSVSNQYLASLQDTTVGLVSRLDVNELLQDIVTRAGALVGTENGYVFLREQDSNEMELRVGVGAYQEFVGRRTEPGNGLAGKVWETGEPIAVDDYRHWTGRLSDPSRDILRAVAGVPLKSHNDVVGVLGLAFLDENRKFGITEMAVLTRFASLASVALDNAQLYANAQRQLEERRRTEAFLDSIVENIPDMIFVKGATPDQSVPLKWTLMNKAAEDLIGAPRTELLGKSDYDFFPTDQATFFQQKDRETLAGKKLVDIPEESIDSVSLGHRFLHTKKIPIVDAEGRPTYLLGISEDITDRKRAEERVLFQNALLDAQNQASLDAILAVSHDDHILSYNKRFAEMWQIAEDVLGAGEGRALRDAALEKVADFADWDRRSQAIIARTSEPSRDKIRFKDGRIIDRYSAPITAADGTYRGRVWYFRDVTSRERAEQLLQMQYNTAQILAESDTLEQAAPKILQNLCETLDWQVGEFWQVDPAVNLLRCVDIWHIDAEAITSFEEGTETLTFAPGKGLVGRVWRDDAPVWMSDIQNDPQFMQKEAAVAAGLQSAFAFPLESEGQVFGVTCFLSQNVEQRDESTVQMMSAIGQQVGQFIYRKRAEEATRVQNLYLAALQDTTVGLVSRLDVNDLLENVVTRAGALVGTENGYVFLREPDSNEMELRVGVGAYEGFVGRRTQQGVGLAGKVWESGEPVIVDDYRGWGGRLADPSRDILRAVVGVPLKSGTEVIGVIGLAYLDDEHKFGPGEIGVLNRFATLASVALDNARLYDTLRLNSAEITRRNRELEVLNRVSMAVTAGLDSRTTLKTVAREMVELFRARNCGIALLNDEGTELTVIADAVAETHEQSAIGIVIPVPGNPSSIEAIETGRTVIIERAQTDPRTEPIHERMADRGTQSLMIVPMLAGGRVIGTIGLDTTDPEHIFNEDEARFAETIASQISAAVENARLFEQTQDRALELSRANEALREAEGSMRAQNTYLMALHDTTLGLMTRLEVEEVLESILTRAGELLGTEHGYVFLVEPTETEMRMRVGVGVYEDFVGTKASPGVGLAGNVWQNKAPVVVDDYQSWPYRLPGVDREVVRAATGVPLKSGDRVVGVLGLAFLEEGRWFTEAEISALNLFAELGAVALDNAQLFQTTRQHASELDALNRISQTVSSRLDLEAALELVGSQMQTLFDVQNVYIALYNPDTNLITLPYFVNDNVRVSVEPILFGEGVTSHIIRTRKPMLINEHADVPMERLGAKTFGNPALSYLGVPIMVGENVIGVISVQSIERENVFSDADVRLLTTIAANVGTAIQNARLYEAAQEEVAVRRLAEEEIKLSLTEKEILLKEIHHRVKNNLQIITSLLNLQSAQIKDSPSYELFKESQARVRSMALIHEKLYQAKDLARVDFDSYVRDLVAYLYRSYGATPDTIEFRCDIRNVLLGVDTAIPCGLIISELVTNCLKYAFPNNHKGSINVALGPVDGGHIALSVVDNGIGLPSEMDIRNTDSLGLQLVNTLTQQLHGSLELHRNGGTGFKIVFPN